MLTWVSRGLNFVNRGGVFVVAVLLLLLLYSVQLAVSIDTSALPVNHCSQSTAFGALNSKARGTCRDEKKKKNRPSGPNSNTT